jgi:pimeloyl-ACP methyl ester carboxylesterase
LNADAPVLLIHGQPGGIRDWDRLVAALGNRANPIAYYRPGWNGAGMATGFAGNADAAIKQLDARGVTRAIVLGHSFGGGVAAWLAVHRPERVSALVLVAAAANVGSLDRTDKLLAEPVIGPLASALSLGAISLALSGRAVRRGLAVRTGLDERVLLADAQMLRRPSSWRSFLIEQRALFSDLPVLESSLSEITAPTTIVTGTADPIVDPNASRRLAEQIPSAELIEIDRAGHLLPHLHAEELAAAVLGAAVRRDVLGAGVNPDVLGAAVRPKAT